MPEMTVAAIIAEYNPFHNGHARHIEKTREAGATHVAVIMSGNFTQRGTPAVAEKRARAEAALMGGADLVVELPLPYAAGTAQRFALGAVSIAEGMGCVDLLSFGSESGYLTILEAAAEAVDSEELSARLPELLATGMTFAKARHNAVSELFGDEVADMLTTPNDSLAVEYIRQLRLIGSRILPVAVRREGPGHDREGAQGEIASASYLRGLWKSGGISALRGLAPEKSLGVLMRAAEEGKAPFADEAQEKMMLAALRRLTPEQLRELPDVSEGLENRVYAAIRQAVTLGEVYSLSKSKRYTMARIRRVVLAAFLGIPRGLSAAPAPYIRILGFNRRGREILAVMKRTASLPVSDSLAYLRKLDRTCLEFADLEARSTDLYTLGLPRVLPCGSDFTDGSIRL